MSSAHDHRRSGRRQPAPKREPSMDKALVDFLAARGVYQRGRHSIDFRSAKNRLDGKRAA